MGTQMAHSTWTRYCCWGYCCNDFPVPLSVTIAAITILSLGYDLTQPLFAAIVTDLSGGQSLGQKMGLTVFTLFAGFGIGGLIFGEVLRLGFIPTLTIFSTVQLLATVAAIPLFRSEIPKRSIIE